MVTRLGMAHGTKETAVVLMALNLLLPYGLNSQLDAHDGSVSLSMAASRGGAVSLISSLEVTALNPPLPPPTPCPNPPPSANTVPSAPSDRPSLSSRSLVATSSSWHSSTPMR